MDMRCFLFICFCMLMPAAGFSQNPACPCCTEEHRQFDFWLGDWETTTPNGQVAGTNHILLMQDSCVIQENWVSATPGYSGTSYNYYNAVDGKWHQVWIDNQGAVLNLSGSRVGNQMILVSDKLKNAEGRPFVNRITWTANSDGTVRQLWETQIEGEEWQVAFDGLYRSKS